MTGIRPRKSCRTYASEQTELEKAWYFFQYFTFLHFCMFNLVTFLTFQFYNFQFQAVQDSEFPTFRIFGFPNFQISNFATVNFLGDHPRRREQQTDRVALKLRLPAFQISKTSCLPSPVCRTPGHASQGHEHESVDTHRNGYVC